MQNDKRNKELQTGGKENSAANASKGKAELGKKKGESGVAHLEQMRGKGMSDAEYRKLFEEFK